MCRSKTVESAKVVGKSITDPFVQMISCFLAKHTPQPGMSSSLQFAVSMSQFTQGKNLLGTMCWKQEPKLTLFESPVLSFVHTRTHNLNTTVIKGKPASMVTSSKCWRKDRNLFTATCNQ